jgi:hypothetical protein
MRENVLSAPDCSFPRLSLQTVSSNSAIVPRMNLYVSLPIISFVGGWLGSFLSSYLNKKGENLAMHEDIKLLVDQVKAVTEATKKIEATISHEFWNRERLWEMKRDAFLNLVKAQSAAVEALTSLGFAFHKSRQAVESDNLVAKQRQAEAMQNWLSADTAFDAARAQASLVCESSLVEQLSSVGALFTTTAKLVSSHQAEFSAHYPQLIEATSSIRAAVQKELGIDVK